MGAMRTALLAAGIVISTLLVPALAIALIAWFGVSLARHHSWPWQFWASGVAAILLLQLLASGMTRLAKRTKQDDLRP